MTKPTYLIVGATGNNGQATIKSLLSKENSDSFTIRAGVRSDEKGKTLRNAFPGIETVNLNLDKPDTLDAAFTGVEKVFLILGNNENREEQTIAAVDAAKRAGSVKNFLFFSVFGAEYKSILFGRQFRAGEEYLEASGLNWTHLRTIFFQENFHGWAEGIKNGALYLGTREGKFAPLNVSDIGEMAANILTSDNHNNKAYNITGPELLNGESLAKVFSDVTGREVAYVSPDTDTTLQSLLSTGWPKWQAEGMLELFEVFAQNQAAVVSPDGEQLLGRKLTTMREFAENNKSQF
jgi:NAD(P)H dehydrogenase (quinone)